MNAWRHGAAAGCIALTACAPERNFGLLVDECQETMPEKVYDHACQHGELGPFETTYAAPSAEHATGLISGRQRAIDVTVPPAALDSDALSYVLYRPSRDGQHAIFSGTDRVGIEISARLLGGAAVPKVPLRPVSNQARCGGMIEVTGFELTSGQTYLFELGPTVSESVRLFIEHVESFSARWSEQCPR